MNLKEKEADIKEIVKALHNCYLDDLNDDEDDLEDNVIEPFKEKYCKPFDWAFGATKLVLIFKKLNFVIKIPLTYCDGEMLCGASDVEDNNWNYCEQEAIRFEWMKDENINQVFAETRHLTNIKGFPIYIQEYAEPLNRIEIENRTSEYYSHTENDTKKIKELSNINNYFLINLEWEADILAYYGEKFYNYFKKVISDYNIIDLRPANIGYINKKPVILDYAGFEY